MSGLHPEFIIFWKNCGKNIGEVKSVHGDIFYYEYESAFSNYVFDPKSLVSHLIAQYSPQTQKIYYMFNGTFYIEQDMLKLIKLKAFL